MDAAGEDAGFDGRAIRAGTDAVRAVDAAVKTGQQPPPLEIGADQPDQASAATER